MQTIRLLRFVAAVALAAHTAPWLYAAEPTLGDPPTAPKDVSGLPGGPEQPSSAADRRGSF